jgi:uncharacterized protein YyaL (SSP411 family)
MKQIYIFLLIGFVGLSFAFRPKIENVSWYEWNDGYPEAKKAKKLLMINMHTTWCGWCKKMDRDTYTDKDVVKLLNDDFVSIKFDPERRDKKYMIDTLSLDGQSLMNLLTNGQRLGFPTTVIINPKDNSIVYAEAGYQDAAQFRKTLQAVLKKVE